MKKKIDLKKIKKFFRSSFIFLLSFGFNIKIFILAVCNYPRYITELYKFKRMGGIVNNNHKSLTDYKEQAGISKGHYFHQDLLVAKYIYKNKPDKHIDIGSRIDGFVAHVATFRSIEIIDIRPLKKSEHKNIKFIKKDLMFHKSIDEKITDSISCLHAIEHFGLGRYGDKLDPNGHIKGFNNIIKMLKKNGKLYISFPVGKRNEIHFNYERIFHPKDIFNWYDNKNDLVLERFDLINDDGDLYENININKQLNVIYGCGIYTFRKIL